MLHSRREKQKYEKQFVISTSLISVYILPANSTIHTGIWYI